MSRRESLPDDREDLRDLVRFLRERGKRVVDGEHFEGRWAGQLHELLARVELLEDVLDAAREVEDTLPLHWYNDAAPAMKLKAALVQLEPEDLGD